MQKQSEAQKEAKRLYKLFYKPLDWDEIADNVRKQIAKEAAILCAKEKEKAATKNSWVPEYWGNLYRDVIRELKKL